MHVCMEGIDKLSVNTVVVISGAGAPGHSHPGEGTDKLTVNTVEIISGAGAPGHSRLEEGTDKSLAHSWLLLWLVFCALPIGLV